jgi:hypothetical protein
MDPSSDELHLAWSMICIGVGIACAGGVGLVLPPGHRFAVALALLLGAGVGIAALFAFMLGGGFDGPEQAMRSFLIASALGLVAVLGGLAMLVRRSRAA